MIIEFLTTYLIFSFFFSMINTGYNISKSPNDPNNKEDILLSILFCWIVPPICLGELLHQWRNKK